MKLLLVLSLILAAGVLRAADRVALVIGNGNYQHLQKLTACPNDAARMAETFQKIGIRIHGGKPLVDLTADQMDRALNDFTRSLGKDSEAFIFYSGHGAQISGINYLLPVGFDAEFEVQARRQAVSLDFILELLEKTDSKLRVVILDACRDPGNLLPGEPKQKGLIRKGLNEQRVEAPETLVCFATKHGQPSLADDKASYYTAVLAEEIVKPVKVEDVMKAVARRVYAATETRQLPFTYGSLLGEHFLAGERVAPGVVPPSAVPTTPAIVKLATPISRPLPATPTPVTPVEMAKLTTPVPPGPGSTGGGAPATATKDNPFTNSLGMEFVRVPGTKVLFCRWETRVKDYRAYAKSVSGVDGEWERPTTNSGDAIAQSEDHPVVNVSWEDAQAFCTWLSRKEGRTYRLPTDAEWSVAVGLGPEIGTTPEEKSGKAAGYPWGAVWPPPRGAGNYSSSLEVDPFERPSPVGTFAANPYGLYDMGGNVWEWCEDWLNAKKASHVLRGAAWNSGTETGLLSSTRFSGYPTSRFVSFSYRCVLELPAK